VLCDHKRKAISHPCFLDSSTLTHPPTHPPTQQILKDVINRYQLINGRRARFVPGWDTHGLPIELKVLQGLPEAERRGLDTLGLRTKAREYALEQVERQREQFKRWGLGRLGGWGGCVGPGSGAEVGAGERALRRVCSGGCGCVAETGGNCIGSSAA